MVELAFFEEKYRKQLLEFNLPEEQHQFTGLPNEVLDLSIEEINRFPIVILKGDDVVGFFVLHHGEKIAPFSTNLKALLLRAFSINFNHQGRGYAKQSMEQLPAFVKKHFPEIEEIVLAVNAKNDSAKSLYEKTGFIDRGERRLGKIGLQFLLHFQL